MNQTGAPIATVEIGHIKALIWRIFGQEENFYTATLTRESTESPDNRRPSQEFTADDFAAVREITILAQRKIAELQMFDRYGVGAETNYV